MKFATLLAALTLGLTTAGFAQADSLSNYPMADSATASTLTRAQVQQELEQAKAHGLLAIGQHQLNYPVLNNEQVSVSRAEVLSELRTVRATGELQLGQEQLSYPGFSA